MINYGKQFIDKKDIKIVTETLKSSNLTQGSKVIEFEKALSKYFKSKYCTVVSSGTSALFLAIKSLGLKKNSKILTSPLTFAATVTSIISNNHLPVLSDINLEDYTLDLNILEKKIKSQKIKAIIGVDYAGHPCDWEGLKFLKNKYDLFLLNDNCHSLGSKLNNDKGYATKYADIVCQSYHPVKNFTTGEGGSILTNRRDLYYKFKDLRSHNIKKESKILDKKGLWYYNIDEVGYNFRLTDIQSALGISQLQKLNTFVKKRRNIASYYEKLFANFDCFITPKENKHVYHSYHLFPLLIEFHKLKISKKIFFKKMLNKKIRLQVHYVPIYKFKFFKKYLQDLNFQNTEYFYNNAVSLPIFYDLNQKDQNKIFTTLTDILNN